MKIEYLTSFSLSTAIRVVRHVQKLAVTGKDEQLDKQVHAAFEIVSRVLEAMRHKG